MIIYHAKHKFLENKYTSIYCNIVDKALSENRSRGECYYELHHILPKSIYTNYSNLKKNDWNGVLLTAREHFVAHKLLVRMFDDKINCAKMLHAVVRLMHSKYTSKIHTSREYEYYKIRASREHSIFVTGNKYCEGKKWYTNENGKSKQFDPDKVPAGWFLGRNAFKKENNSVSGTKWFWNPITGIKGMFIPGNQPEGYILGRGSIASKGKKSYYDPLTKETKRFEPGKQPEDWLPGFGTILGENHWNYKKALTSSVLQQRLQT